MIADGIYIRLLGLSLGKGLENIICEYLRNLRTNPATLRVCRLDWSSRNRCCLSRPRCKINWPPRCQSAQTNRPIIRGDNCIAIHCLYFDSINVRHLGRPHAGVRYDSLDDILMIIARLAKYVRRRERSPNFAKRPPYFAAQGHSCGSCVRCTYMGCHVGHIAN